MKLHNFGVTSSLGWSQDFGAKIFLKNHYKTLKVKMQNCPSNFHSFSFQSSNFQFCQFSSLTFNFCQWRILLNPSYGLPLMSLKRHHFSFFFFSKLKEKKKKMYKKKKKKKRKRKHLQ